MSRRWLIVLEDRGSVFSSPEELEAYLGAAVDWELMGVEIARIRRGGLLADKVMDELPPERHALMGRRRG